MAKVTHDGGCMNRREVRRQNPPCQVGHGALFALSRFHQPHQEIALRKEVTCQSAVRKADQVGGLNDRPVCRSSHPQALPPSSTVLR